MVVTTKQCECGNRFHTQCLSLSFMDAETQVESHVNMDQRNLGSCLLQHARQDVDRDSPAKNTRGQESAVNTKNKNVRGKSITKVSVQYLHMQECLVYAAVDVLQQALEGASMFRYSNKTQAFTKIRRHQCVHSYHVSPENDCKYLYHVSLECMCMIMTCVSEDECLYSLHASLKYEYLYLSHVSLENECLYSSHVYLEDECVYSFRVSLENECVHSL